MLQILIADDMENIREGLRSMLRHMAEEEGPLRGNVGEILTASNGLEAMEILGRTQIDLLITDIRMPDMDGIGLMEECLRLWPRLSIFVVSGYDDFQYAKKAIECGAKAYLLKPIDKAELYGALERVCLSAAQPQLQGHISQVCLPYLGAGPGTRPLKKGWPTNTPS